MIYNLIFNYKKIHNLFALKNLKFLKNAQNRQIEQILRVHNLWTLKICFQFQFFFMDYKN